MERKKTNPQVGSHFEDFLDEEGRLESSTVHAVRRVLVWQIEHGMSVDDLRKEYGLTR